MLLITALAVIMLWRRDSNPPQQPTLCCRRNGLPKPIHPEVHIAYQDASDDISVQEVRLWAKFGRKGKWRQTEEARTALSGTLKYDSFGDSGTYFFDAVTIDHQGTPSHSPINTSGQQEFLYIPAAERADVKAVVDVLSRESHLGDTATRLNRYIQTYRSDLAPADVSRFREAIRRLDQPDTDPSDPSITPPPTRDGSNSTIRDGAVRMPRGELVPLDRTELVPVPELLIQDESESGTLDESESQHRNQ